MFYPELYDYPQFVLLKVFLIYYTHITRCSFKSWEFFFLCVLYSTLLVVMRIDFPLRKSDLSLTKLGCLSHKAFYAFSTRREKADGSKSCCAGLVQFRNHDRLLLVPFFQKSTFSEKFISKGLNYSTFYFTASGGIIRPGILIGRHPLASFLWLPRLRHQALQALLFLYASFSYLLV